MKSVKENEKIATRYREDMIQVFVSLFSICQCNMSITFDIR